MSSKLMFISSKLIYSKILRSVLGSNFSSFKGSSYLITGGSGSFSVACEGSPCDYFSSILIFGYSSPSFRPGGENSPAFMLDEEPFET